MYKCLLSIMFSYCASLEYHVLALVVAQHGPNTLFPV